MKFWWQDRISSSKNIGCQKNRWAESISNLNLPFNLLFSKLKLTIWKSLAGTEVETILFQVVQMELFNSDNWMLWVSSKNSKLVDGNKKALDMFLLPNLEEFIQVVPTVASKFGLREFHFLILIMCKKLPSRDYQRIDRRSTSKSWLKNSTYREWKMWSVERRRSNSKNYQK